MQPGKKPRDLLKILRAVLSGRLERKTLAGIKRAMDRAPRPWLS
jgi:hypothetical protein